MQPLIWKTPSLPLVVACPWLGVHSVSVTSNAGIIGTAYAVSEVTNSWPDLGLQRVGASPAPAKAWVTGPAMLSQSSKKDVAHSLLP